MTALLCFAIKSLHFAKMFFQEVRKTIVLSLPPSNATTQAIIDCTLDVNESVRKAAYFVLANKVPLQSLRSDSEFRLTAYSVLCFCFSVTVRLIDKGYIFFYFPALASSLGQQFCREGLLIAL